MNNLELLLRVKKIIPETYDSKTFILEPISQPKLSYRAGQFLTLVFDFHGRSVRRSYSLSSAPNVDALPAITVKRLPNGEVSRYILDSIKEGDVLKSLLPAGLFVFEESENVGVANIILIGAGSGVVPLFSILKQVLTTVARIKVLLIYANRNSSQTLFLNALKMWELKFPDRLKIVYLQSQPEDNCMGMVGRLNNTRLQQMMQERVGDAIPSSKVFVCGPSDFMRTVSITLKYVGFESEQIRKENFMISKPVATAVLSSTQKIKLEFKGQEYELLVPENTSILDAAHQNGINLPYSCKAGHCSTCMARCTSGAVGLSYNEVLSERDLKSGLILTCCAFVNERDVRIEIH